MVSYAILGDFAVHDAEGRLIHIPSGRTQQVLAKLLINHDRVVRTEALIQAGWGDNPPESVQIHKIISEINKALGPADGRPRVENRARQGYCLRLVADDDADAVSFEQALNQANAQPPATAIATLRRALAYWRGQRALANFPDDVLSGDVKRLTRLRREAMVSLLKLEINESGYPPIVAEAVEFAELFPTDHRLRELAMIAAYRCGQVTDALHAYQRYEDAVLEDPLGTHNAETKRLSYAMLRGDDEFISARERSLGLTAPVTDAGEVPIELRAAPPRLIARDDLLAEATWLLRRGGDDGPPVVLVISGRSGIGKTAMARAVAHTVLRDHYPGGALYLELRDATGAPVDASECLAHALRALKIRVPESRTERAAALRSALARRRMLLVLDDAHDENQVRDLIPGSGSSAVIITSHHDLPGLEGARTLRTLQELDPAEALDLYRELVRAHGLDPDADDQGQTERLLDLCDGLPLAISVVAALRVRERARPVADLADRLARLGPVALEYDDRSVARSIGASLERLDDDARALFLGLGRVHLADIGAWTAWAVLNRADADGPDPGRSGPDLYGALSQLLASNVLVADGPGRYRLHALTRQYAAWCAEQDAAPGHGDVARRVYQALLTLVRRAHGALVGGDYEVVHSSVADWPAPEALLAEVTRDPLAWFGRARANIRAAVFHCAELGHHELSWDLAVSAHEYYTMAGQHDDWYETHTAALAACREAGDDRGEAVLLVSLGQPALVASRRAGAVGVADLRRAADRLRDLGDEHGLAIALRTLANALRRQGRLAEPLRLFEEALQLYARCDDVMGRWQTQRFIGQSYLDGGDHDRAVTILTEALDDAQRLGSTRFIAQSHYWLGQAYLAASADLDRAEDSFRWMLDTVGDPPGLGRAYALHGLGEVARRRGALDAAREQLAEAARLAREGRDAGLEGRVYVAQAALWRDRGDLEAEIAALNDAHACFVAGEHHYRGLATLVALANAFPAHSPQSRAAWARVMARYAELDLPEEDRIHRPPPDPGAGRPRPSAGT